MFPWVAGALLQLTATGGCAPVPSPPTDVVASAAATSLTVRWKAPASGSPTEYHVEYGNAPGSTYLGTVDTGSPATSFTETKTAGTYYVRVRAKNRCGPSAVSLEVKVDVDPIHIGRRTAPDVVVAARTPTRNTYFPTAERLKNGDIVVVYYDSPDHVSSAGRIALVRSRDGGRTWSAPVVVIDGPRDERDPGIMQTTRGTWLLTYFEADSEQYPSSQGVFVIRSDDEGQTWSPPLKIDTALRGAASSAKIVEMENGDLLLPLYGLLLDRREAVATVVRSSDEGRTWPNDQEVRIAEATGVDFVEPVLANLGQGRLLAMLGVERGAAHETYSLDGGRTWSVPTRTPLIAQASDLLALDGPEGDLLVHTWGDSSGQFGASRPALLRVVRFSEFPAVAWFDVPRLLHQGRCWSDEGYPSSVLLPGGRVFTVYYDACAGYIGGTFSSLPVPAAMGGCGAVPAAPGNLRIVANRNGGVTLAWNATGEPDIAHVLEAGRAPGLSDAIKVDLGSETIFNDPRVAPATYYVRVRGKSPCGTGDASNEIVVVVR